MNSSSILFVESCCTDQSMQFKDPCKTWELWSTLLTCCFSALSLSSRPLWGTDLLSYNSKVSKADPYSPLKEPKNHESRVIMRETFSCGAGSWKITHYGVAAVVSLATKYPWKMSRHHWTYTSHVQSEARLTLKKMWLMWFYACLCGWSLSQPVCETLF